MRNSESEVRLKLISVANEGHSGDWLVLKDQLDSISREFCMEIIHSILTESWAGKNSHLQMNSPPSLSEMNLSLHFVQCGRVICSENVSPPWRPCRLRERKGFFRSQAGMLGVRPSLKSDSQDFATKSQIGV